MFQYLLNNDGETLQGWKVRVVLVHHDVGEKPPQLGLLRAKVAEALGAEVVAAGIREARGAVGEGDAVFGLFVYEANHADQVRRLVLGRGASWMGVIPPWLIAGAALREAALRRARSMLLVSHRSKGLVEKQLGRVEEVMNIIRSHGVKVEHVFLGDPVGRVDMDLVFPLTVFRGWTWEYACRLAGESGLERCAPPLVEGFWRVLVGWIVSSLRPCCR